MAAVTLVPLCVKVLQNRHATHQNPIEVRAVGEPLVGPNVAAWAVHSAERPAFGLGLLILQADDQATAW